MRSVAFAIALLLAAPAPAAAQSKAWGAAVKIMLARDADAARIAATVKQVCGIDAADSVDSLTLGAPDPRDGKPSGVAIVGLAGVDEARLRACAPKYARATGKPVVLTRGGDGVTEVTHDGHQLWVAFVTPRKMAVAFDPGDRPVLAAMLPRRSNAPGTATGATTLPPPGPAQRTLNLAEKRLRELAALAELLRARTAEALLDQIDDLF